MWDEAITINANWGVRPILATVFGVNIPAYETFVSLGLIAGILTYFWQASKRKSIHDRGYLIPIAAIGGGILGAKLPVWVMNAPEIIRNFSNPAYLLSGRTLVGGFIGGIVAVNVVKRRLGIREKTGNPFVPALAIALLFGRIGCYLRGCCYGVATTMPWGVDFGDGITRHPTQLYEVAFFLVVLLWSLQRDPSKVVAGKMFQQFIVSYFVFRFLIEFIREEPLFAVGLTLAQVVSLLVIAYYSIEYLSASRMRIVTTKHGTR